MLKNILIGFLCIFNLTFSYINIHPTSFDKRIDFQGSFQEYTLENNSSNPLMYRIYLEEHRDKKLSMKDYIDYYPKSLTLKPGESGTIKVHISSNCQIPKGEYFAILGIRELPVFLEKSQDKSNIKILTDLKLSLMGYGGDIYSDLKFKNLKLINKNQKIILGGSIENIGEKRGKYEIYLNDHFLGNLRILSKETLNLENLDFSSNEKILSKNKIKFLDYETKELKYEINL
ncbi:MAG: hypothetical protein ACRC1R_05605 [Cetobacterium sp.]|uniref:hypothetical protein n=1 Tax=Cetobacterium sp. TaxID=2071632 RepID=UPI003F2DE0F8